MQKRVIVSRFRKPIGVFSLALPFVLTGAASAGSETAGSARAEAAEARPQTERRQKHSHRRAGRRSMRAGASRPERFAERLGLTEEQSGQLRAALRENRDERREIAREIAEARRSLREASRDPERPEAEILELGAALGRARADGILRARAGRERIAAILTEEQRARFADLRERGPRERGYRDRRSDRDRRRTPM